MTITKIEGRPEVHLVISLRERQTIFEEIFGQNLTVYDGFVTFHNHREKTKWETLIFLPEFLISSSKITWFLYSNLPLGTHLNMHENRSITMEYDHEVYAYYGTTTSMLHDILDSRTIVFVYQNLEDRYESR